MKQFGIFKAMAVFFASVFHASPQKAYGVRGYRGEGRAAFYGVSAPRCHTQKKRYY